MFRAADEQTEEAVSLMNNVMGVSYEPVYESSPREKKAELFAFEVVPCLCKKISVHLILFSLRSLQLHGYCSSELYGLAFQYKIT